NRIDVPVYLGIVGRLPDRVVRINRDCNDRRNHQQRQKNEANRAAPTRVGLLPLAISVFHWRAARLLLLLFLYLCHFSYPRYPLVSKATDSRPGRCSPCTEIL